MGRGSKMASLRGMGRGSAGARLLGMGRGNAGYVEPIAPKLTKLYVAVYQNVRLEKSNQMIPRASPHLN